MSITRLPLPGPTRETLAHRQRIDWHDHAVNQLISPGIGVLVVSTPTGTWAVPPHRAVWIPAGIAHAHEAHGPSEMRTLCFAADVNPLRLDRPTVLAVSPLLREIVAVLTGAAHSTDGTSPDLPPDLPHEQRRNLERVALDQLQRVEALPLGLPAPRDARLRDVAALLTADPGDGRTLAELGAAVGASERTLSRLFRAETGMSFPQWRAQLRLHHSLRLLAGGASVTSVAAACGYATPSAFIESFRRAFGTTPGAYRGGGAHT